MLRLTTSQPTGERSLNPVTSRGLQDPEATIIIPALNEEASIRETIDRIPNAVKASSEILVIDGSSDDDTVLEAEEAGAEVIIVGRLGKGFAMQVGAMLAKGETVVFLDGDGTYPSEDIPRFLEEVKENVLVIGNFLPSIASRKSLVEKLRLLYPSFLFSRFVFSRYGIDLQDPLNGMRAMKKTDFHRLNLSSNGFAIETEMDIKALSHGFRIVEVPIQITERKGKSKFLFNFRSHLKIIHLLRSNTKAVEHAL